MLDKMLVYVSYNRRTEREVVGKAKAITEKYLGFYPDYSQQLSLLPEEFLEYLKELKFVDDEKFVSDYLRGFVDSHKAYNKNKARNFLMKKGISQSLINKGMLDVPLDLESDSAIKVAEKKFRLLGKYDKPTQKKKLWQFLAGKGYSSDNVSAVIDTIFKLN